MARHYKTYDEEFKKNIVKLMENEDSVTLPYTYFGLGKFRNERNSFTEEQGKKHPILLYDIILDN